VADDMTIELDHTIVPSHDKVASARLLGELLAVEWAESGVGPFAPVYVNDDSILGRIRAAGIRYRSTVRGPVDMQVSTQFGGRGVYWNEPDGHQWEMLTVSYARPIR
jgi:hypothetical protein